MRTESVGPSEAIFVLTRGLAEEEAQEQPARAAGPDEPTDAAIAQVLAEANDNIRAIDGLLGSMLASSRALADGGARPRASAEGADEAYREAGRPPDAHRSAREIDALVTSMVDRFSTYDARGRLVGH